MKNLLRITILVTLFFSLSACGSSQVEANPAAVIEEMEAEWNAKDAEGVISMFAEDAVERNSRGIYYGREELVDIFTAAINAFSMECGNYLIAGNTGHELYYDCLQTFYSDGHLQVERYEAIILDGKIKANIATEKFAAQKEFKIDSALP